jgi:hypothetical protein
LVGLKELKIEYVPKEENPPNVSQIRPIEFFLGNLKRKVYSNKRCEVLDDKDQKRAKVH